jgi:hypothetical protein
MPSTLLLQSSVSQVFCKKHLELHPCFLHAHSAIFISSTKPLPPSPGTAVGAAAAAAATEAGADRDTGAAAPAGSPTDSSSSSSTNRHHCTIAAIILERANGKTVKQRVKSKVWADAQYLAKLLLELPRVGRALEDELGFVHDDLR